MDYRYYFNPTVKVGSNLKLFPETYDSPSQALRMLIEKTQLHYGDEWEFNGSGNQIDGLQIVTKEWNENIIGMVHCVLTEREILEQKIKYCETAIENTKANIAEYTAQLQALKE